MPAKLVLQFYKSRIQVEDNDLSSKINLIPSVAFAAFAAVRPNTLVL